jgi:protein arginine N-methyltransferase 2
MVTAEDYSRQLFHLIQNHPVDPHDKDKRVHSMQSIESLLNQAAENDIPWLVDGESRTALHISCMFGHQDIVHLLLGAGLPYNAQDSQGLTAAEYARLFGFPALYDLLVEEGVRSEMLFSVLHDDAAESDQNNFSYLSDKVEYSSDDQLLKDSEGQGVMMEWERPIMQRHAELLCRSQLSSEDLSNLSSNPNGMVQRPLQLQASEEQPEQTNGDNYYAVLNIGFGLGLIDSMINRLLIKRHQATGQRCIHYIIEAHPQVQQKMREAGWLNELSGGGQQPEIRVLCGRWQDCIDRLYETGVQFDGIFYDTFGERYEAMRKLHDHVVNWLRPETGFYSFFNGLGGTNEFFHDVSCRLVEIEMNDLGMKCEWEQMSICEDHNTGIQKKTILRPYFTLQQYRLPKCQFIN